MDLKNPFRNNVCYLFKVNPEPMYFPGRIPLSMVWCQWYFTFSSLKPDFLLMKRILSKYSPIYRIYVMLSLIYPVWGRHFRVEIIYHFPVLLLISTFFERSLVVICCKLAIVNRKYKKIYFEELNRAPSNLRKIYAMGILHRRKFLWLYISDITHACLFLKVWTLKHRHIFSPKYLLHRHSSVYLFHCI